jgi:hypothetical protein
VSDLDRALVIGRATYERWLGTEPDEIVAAADNLRRIEPDHSTLPVLAIRLRHAHRIKAMLRQTVEAAHPRQDARL